MTFVLVVCYLWYASGVTTNVAQPHDEERTIHLTTK